MKFIPENAIERIDLDEIKELINQYISVVIDRELHEKEWDEIKLKGADSIQEYAALTVLVRVAQLLGMWDEYDKFMLERIKMMNSEGQEA